jgi:hypothetical protein
METARKIFNVSPCYSLGSRHSVKVNGTCESFKVAMNFYNIAFRSVLLADGRLDSPFSHSEQVPALLLVAS